MRLWAAAHEEAGLGPLPEAQQSPDSDTDADEDNIRRCEIQPPLFPHYKFT